VERRPAARPGWKAAGRLRTNQPFDLTGGESGALMARGDLARGFLNQMSAAVALVAGAPGFFRPRIPSPWFHPFGTVEATSYYDTTQLKATLKSLVDFDRVNSDHANPRLSLGAVNVRSGNLVYFDSPTQIITPEHVMASGALPPGFPAVEIEGEYYWDGGLVSNTPLQWIGMTQRPRDSLVFQVDLWSAKGEFPRNLAEVATRQKEIQYSSRTRAFTDYFKHVTKLRNMVAELLEELPAEMKQSERVKFLSLAVERHAANIVQLIYRPKGYEGDSKDYEFSRRSMEEHWRAGYYDAVHALAIPKFSSGRLAGMKRSSPSIPAVMAAIEAQRNQGHGVEARPFFGRRPLKGHGASTGNSIQREPPVSSVLRTKGAAFPGHGRNTA
jgi:NTE family protein